MIERMGETRYETFLNQSLLHLVEQEVIRETERVRGVSCHFWL